MRDSPLRTAAGCSTLDRLRETVATAVRETTIHSVLSAFADALADDAGHPIVDRAIATAVRCLGSRPALGRDDRERHFEHTGSFGEIIGQSAAIRNLAEQIELVAPTDASVLILGESGTGKELVANEIHARSGRSRCRIVKVNCASVPRELYESEFFGHVRGAFTGALKDRAGRFELANGGTLFLDEIGEIPYHLQGKLLRVLQEREFERVGEEVTRRVDVRIISATNRNLKAELEGGRFRRDLYYRLALFPVDVAPLRQRKEDIPLLAAHFLKQAAASFGRPEPRLTQAAIIRLQQYHWPGNVRELRNEIERAVIVARGGAMQFSLPCDFAAPDAAGMPSPVEVEGMTHRTFVTEVEMKRQERENLLAALQHAGWKIYGSGGAAELLGLSPTTLHSRIRKAGLQRPSRAAPMNPR